LFGIALGEPSVCKWFQLEGWPSDRLTEHVASRPRKGDWAEDDQ